MTLRRPCAWWHVTLARCRPGRNTKETMATWAPLLTRHRAESAWKPMGSRHSHVLLLQLLQLNLCVPSLVVINAELPSGES